VSIKNEGTNTAGPALTLPIRHALLRRPWRGARGRAPRRHALVRVRSARLRYRSRMRRRPRARGAAALGRCHELCDCLGDVVRVWGIGRLEHCHEMLEHAPLLPNTQVLRRSGLWLSDNRARQQIVVERSAKSSVVALRKSMLCGKCSGQSSPIAVASFTGPWRPRLALARATTASGGTDFRRKPGNEFLPAKWWKCF
jgi:hypothetical protein